MRARRFHVARHFFPRANRGRTRWGCGERKKSMPLGWLCRGARRMMLWSNCWWWPTVGTDGHGSLGSHAGGEAGLEGGGANWSFGAFSLEEIPVLDDLRRGSGHVGGGNGRRRQRCGGSWWHGGQGQERGGVVASGSAKRGRFRGSGYAGAVHPGRRHDYSRKEWWHVLCPSSLWTWRSFWRRTSTRWPH